MKFTEEHKRKISLSLRNRKLSDLHKSNVSIGQRLRFKTYSDSLQTRNKKSESHKGKVGYWRNKRFPEEIKEKIRKTLKEKWSDKIYREFRIKKILLGIDNKDNNYENKIKELIKINNLKFKYVGDGSLVINFKNPDFINFENKEIIEVYNSYFKIKSFGSIKNYQKERIKAFEGWKVIFINEEQMNKKDWKEECLRLIKL